MGHLIFNTDVQSHDMGQLIIKDILSTDPTMPGSIIFQALMLSFAMENLNGKDNPNKAIVDKICAESRTGVVPFLFSIYPADHGQKAVIVIITNKDAAQKRQEFIEFISNEYNLEPGSVYPRWKNYGKLHLRFKGESASFNTFDYQILTTYFATDDERCITGALNVVDDKAAA